MSAREELEAYFSEVGIHTEEWKRKGLELRQEHVARLLADAIDQLRADMTSEIEDIRADVPHAADQTADDNIKPKK